MENKPKIKFRNFWIWFKDQVKRRRVFINFFVTRNAWGAFSINSHINQHNGKEKVMYPTIESAKRVAEAMSKKCGVHFSFYKCLLAIISERTERIRLRDTISLLKNDY